MKVLLDTCVLSELRHPRCDPRVRAAVAAQSDDQLFLSVLTLGEIRKGISLLAEGKRRRALEVWLAGLSGQFPDRIVPVDDQISSLWGELSAAAQANGRSIPAIDGLIAATALCHGMSLMTRNVDDFAATGVRLINPWSAPAVHDSE